MGSLIIYIPGKPVINIPGITCNICIYIYIYLGLPVIYIYIYIYLRLPIIYIPGITCCSRWPSSVPCLRIAHLYFSNADGVTRNDLLSEDTFRQLFQPMQDNLSSPYSQVMLGVAGNLLGCCRGQFYSYSLVGFIDYVYWICNSKQSDTDVIGKLKCCSLASVENKNVAEMFNH